MADKTTAAPKAVSTQPEAEPKKAKKERTVYQAVFPSAEAAVKAAQSRPKGPRRAFTVKFADKTMHVVAHNEGRAGGVAFKEIGGAVDEIGKARKAPKMASLDTIMSAVNALPEAERAKVLEQLKGLNGAKK